MFMGIRNAKRYRITNPETGHQATVVAVLPRGLEDVSKLPVLTSALLERGYSEDDVLKVLGGNLLRVFRRVEEVAARLQRTTPPGLSRLPYVGQEPDRSEQP